MRSPIPCILATCALAAASASAQGPTPWLEHDAPWLGHDLTLTLLGGPPLSSLRLFESDAAGSQPTPYGLLELDRSSLHVAANGSTDADGRFETSLAIPLDAALAETEVHYQALVTDPTAPGGQVLSRALHMRRVGARFYASSAGSAGADAGGLAIVSAVTHALVATVDYGVPDVSAPSRATRPVFADDLSRAAVMSPDGDLLLFDPFFGGVLDTVSLPGSSRRLAATDGGQVVVALQPTGPGGAGLLRSFDIATGALLGSLELPRESTGNWCWNPELDEVYVVERDHHHDRRWIRRVGLQGLQDLGDTEVGRLRSFEVGEMAVAGSSIWFASFDFSPCITLGHGSGTLFRVDYGSDPPVVLSLATGSAISHLAPAPDVGGLFDFENVIPCWGPGFRLTLRGMNDLQQWDSFGLPPGWDDGSAAELCWDLDRLWLPMPTTLDGNQGLVRFRYPGATWTTFHLPPPGPKHAEAVRDTLLHAVALLGTFYVPDPYHPANWLIFVDPETGPEEHLRVRASPESLLGVGIP